MKYGMKPPSAIELYNGYYILAAKDNTRAARCLHAKNIVISCCRMYEGRAIYRIESSEYQRLGSAADCFERIAFRGLPSLIKRYRARPGILIGAIIFASILHISTMFIWRMDITGVGKVEESEICESLDKLGCRVGSFIPSLNFYKICNQCLLDSDKLAWLTVNMRGTTAYVEYRERVMPELAEADVYGETPANLIASRAGVVTAVEALGGKAVAQVGSYVERGQLLIAGVFTNRYDEITVTRAKGSCYAQTMDIIEAEIPYKTVETVYTGQTAKEYSLIIFGKTFKLTSKRFTNNEKYDMITKEEQLVIFGEVRLPITVICSEYKFQSDEPKTLTQEEARAAALRLLYEKLDERFCKADILSRETIEYADSDAFRIRCEVTAIEDIAVSSAME